jgi:2Fe-2S ferredoxin
MAVRVRFLPSGAEVLVEAGASLHDAARRAGLPIASACGADGICGRCVVMCVHGAEQLPVETRAESELKARNRVDARYRLACRVAPRGDVTVTAPYW